MSLKILGGKIKGFNIKVDRLEVGITRPTGVILRRRVFDYQQNFSATVLIDAMAGSGIMGLEALSRGAEEICFIDQYHLAIKELKKNIERLNLSFPDISINEKTFLWNMSFVNWLKAENNRNDSIFKRWQKNGWKVIIFLDPPYAQMNLYLEVISLLKSLAKNYSFELWIEGPNDKGVNNFKNEYLKGAKVIKEFTQGKSFLFLIQFETDENS